MKYTKTWSELISIFSMSTTARIRTSGSNVVYFIFYVNIMVFHGHRNSGSYFNNKNRLARRGSVASSTSQQGQGVRIFRLFPFSPRFFHFSWFLPIFRGENLLPCPSWLHQWQGGFELATTGLFMCKKLFLRNNRFFVRFWTIRSGVFAKRAKTLPTGIRNNTHSSTSCPTSTLPHFKWGGG